MENSHPPGLASDSYSTKNTSDIKGITSQTEATLVFKCVCGQVIIADGTYEQACKLKVARCPKCGRGRRFDNLQVVQLGGDSVN